MEPADPPDSLAAVPDGAGDDLAAGLARYLADQRADAAAAARARERWLRQASDEDMQVAGVLLDLAERADAVVVSGPGGRTHRGRVVAVGEDFAVLRTATGHVVLVLAAMGPIRAEGRPVHGSDRARALDMALAEALSALAAERPRALLVTRDGSGVAGELRSAGRDVVVLHLADAGDAAYVPVAALAEVTLPDG